MKLDKRIISGKKPLDCFDVDIARQFIGKKGYFGTHESQFMDFDTCSKCVMEELKEVDNYDDCPFISKGGCSYRRFLPAAWLKPEEPEKKYRAFSLNEFLERYKIGDTVTFRLKKDEYIPEAECLIEYKRMITGYEILPEDKDTPGKGSILLGGCPPTGLARLFEFYELENDGKWQPFGVIDEDKE